MEKKLVERLQEVKKDLEGIINRLEENDIEDYLLDIFHVGGILEEWITGKIENEAIRDMALEVSNKLNKITRKEILKKNFTRRNKKIFIATIKKVLEVINEELPKEERIEDLEENLMESEISFPKYNFYSEEKIQKMIYDNARAIARLLVNNE